jgi:hypothetical protein
MDKIYGGKRGKEMKIRICPCPRHIWLLTGGDLLHAQATLHQDKELGTHWIWRYTVTRACLKVCNRKNFFPIRRFVSNGATAHNGPPHCRGFTITLFRHTTLGRTHLDEWPARRRELYLTTHITHKRQTPMPLAGFEPTIPARERPLTHALGHATTGIGPIGD